MKKNSFLRLFAPISIAALATLASCSGSQTTKAHDHVYAIEGTVQTEATCHSEGLMVYPCTFKGCEATRTEPIPTTDHNLGDPFVTEPATCTSRGSETASCQNEGCDYTETNPIEKISHTFGTPTVVSEPDLLVKGQESASCTGAGCTETSVTTLSAKAELARQFSLAEKGRWDYGTVSSLDVASGVDFETIPAGEDAYSNGSVSISKSSVTATGLAAIKYSFTQENIDTIEVIAKVGFTGKADTTKVRAKLVYADDKGNVFKSIALNASEEKDWQATTEAVEVFEGYSSYLIFENVGAGEATGALEYSLEAKCIHIYDVGSTTKEPTEVSDGSYTRTCQNDGCGHTYVTVIPATGPSEERTWKNANYHDDFSTTEDKGWTYGYISKADYFSAERKEQALAPTLLEAEGNRWHSVTSSKGETDTGFVFQDDYFESDWQNEELMPVVGYTVPTGVDTVEYAVNMWIDEELKDPSREGDVPHWISRVVVADAEGNVKKNEWSGKGQSSGEWDNTYTFEVQEGDRLYLVLEHSGGYASGHFNIVIK